MTDSPKAQLLDAIKMHVPFDGWTRPAYQAAVADTGIDPVLARAVCPRGAVDLAIAFHQDGDAQMVTRMAEPDVAEMKIREKITFAVRTRLELVEDKELVRRGMTLFSLPQNAADGTKLVWQTCDAIWNSIGDTSDDVNWYTKRATLAGVYSSTVLYWLGDESEGHEATWAFLDRRIENVMQIEKVKATVRKSPLLSKLMAGPNAVLSHIKAPSRLNDQGLPGHMAPKSQS
ncbi:MAG: COQ9 family protein [Donghicola eburneus]|nr:COQ9 family protein [Donghicola eburneus]MCI5039980.1 COQ9 family protein [Donghicola eburneus]